MLVPKMAAREYGDNLSSGPGPNIGIAVMLVGLVVLVIFNAVDFTVCVAAVVLATGVVELDAIDAV